MTCHYLLKKQIFMKCNMQQTIFKVQPMLGRKVYFKKNVCATITVGPTRKSSCDESLGAFFTCIYGVLCTRAILLHAKNAPKLWSQPLLCFVGQTVHRSDLIQIINKKINVWWWLTKTDKNGMLNSHIFDLIFREREKRSSHCLLRALYYILLPSRYIFVGTYYLRSI